MIYRLHDFFVTYIRTIKNTILIYDTPHSIDDEIVLFTATNKKRNKLTVIEIDSDIYIKFRDIYILTVNFNTAIDYLLMFLTE